MVRPVGQDEIGFAVLPASRRALREREAGAGGPAHARVRRHSRAHLRPGLDDTTRARLKGLLTLVMVGAMSASMLVLKEGAAQADAPATASSAPGQAAAARAGRSLVSSSVPAATKPAPVATTSGHRRSASRHAPASSGDRKTAPQVTASASASSRATGSSQASTGGARTVAGVQGSLPFATNCPVSATLVPSCGAYWGIYSRRYGNRDVATSVTTWESMLGRRFDIVLMYYDFSNRLGPGRFPDRQMTQLSQDRIPLYDWETRDYVAGTYLRWADIAAGTYDNSVVIPEAQRLKAYGKPVMLGLDHEMDISYAKHGSPAEYRAMYRHIHDVFAAQGVHNVVWVWDVTGWLGSNRGDLVKSFYPGDDLVDWIGYDPYNSGKCNGGGWKTFEQTISTFYRWTAANGLSSKPLLLQEYGLTPDPADPAASQQWYRDIPSVLQRYPRLKALVRWDSDTGCTLRIDAGPGMLDAFKQAGLAIPRP
jgi:Glycosyl hydrolase family 26